ncbi:FRG1-like family-domain-containing protein [Neohortaea acidophila]|uniref:FRG1-like family-domain-containing protein n=1 Tax=Neohortaea acidophila TaxID=245834 RepID=A0A6A6PUH6_9PEZI|nr:FRG1-like family-domain-containing protein [Neohortaea acidophila]KAF2483565.1 FRG1-like family-domain-containing protein [Neohortaea acidophila]
MVKALTFKGDKKAKKRKRTAAEADDEPSQRPHPSENEGGAEEDDNWVSAESVTDISGPVLLVLPTEPPTCLATDAMGKVHASAIENMVEGSPHTAEPHLVSQVWVATRVVGSEKDFTFKGHHGRYLGCDKYGICSAVREAISPEETFKCAASAEAVGMFDIETGRGTFISVEGEENAPQVRGDAEGAGEKTHLRVRMQARFKPKHQVEKAEKVRAKISRKELEDEVGRRLEDDEVKVLKRARREGNYHEAMLDVKVKGKHDKYA